MSIPHPDRFKDENFCKRLNCCLLHLGAFLEHELQQTYSLSEGEKFAFQRVKHELYQILKEYKIQLKE